MSGGKDPDVERAMRRADAAHARVGELEGMVTDLAQAVTAVVDENRPVRSWILAEDHEQARADLVDLAEWLERVYLRYPDTYLPECWAWHPAVVEELLVLRNLHAAAGRGRSWTAVGEWHDRWLPGVRERIRRDAGTCGLEEHLAGKTKGRAPAGPPVVTPMVQHLDAVLDAWMNTGLPPAPSQQQLEDAHEHQQMIFNPRVS